MKKKYVLLFFLTVFFFNLIYSQETDTLKFYWFTTQKHSQITTQDGYKNGQATYWNFFGKKIMEVNYHFDTLNGEFKGWYANGQIKFSGNYTNGKQNGKWYYWYRNGKIAAVQNFVLDEPNDFWYTWFKNGQLQSRSYYLDGEEEGI